MKVSEQGIQNLAQALAKFQGEVKNPLNEATNPQFRSKYAPLDVVINTAKPILVKYGLSFIQSTSTDGENVGITTLLMHESGEWIESDTLFLPAYQSKSGGAKEFNAQAIGSSTTYGRRYSLSAILGLSSEDDDDANGQVFGDSKGTAATNNQKGNDAPATTSAPSAREKAIAAANERKAAKEAEKQDHQNGSPDVSDHLPPFDVNEPTVEPMNEAQKKAVGNQLELVNKKLKGEFDKDKYIAEQVGKFGKSSLDELSFEQGAQIMKDLNTYFRNIAVNK